MGPTTSERAQKQLAGARRNCDQIHTAASTVGMVRLSALLAVPCASDGQGDVGVRGMLGP